MATRKMKKSVDVETGTLSIEIAGKKSIYDLNDLNEKVYIRAALHGLSQKLGDSCAGKEPNFGIIDEVWKQISGPEGEWSARKPAKEKADVEKLRAAMEAQGMAAELIEQVIAASK